MIPNPADGFCAERVHGSSGSAKRRRERRLRSMLRHERMSVAMAEKLHHSSRGQRMARAGKKSPAGGGPRLSLSFGRKRGSCGTPWSTSLTLCVSLPWCRSSMHLCRRRGISCRTSCLSSTRSCLIPSRPSKCPRSCSMMFLCAPLSVTRSWGNSWWKYGSRLEGLFEARDTTYSQRTGSSFSGSWRGWCSWRSSRFSCWTEFNRVFEQIVENPVPQIRREGGGGLQVSLPVQNSAAVVEQIVDIPAFQIFSRARVLLPHRVVCMTLRMRILQGVSTLFPVRKKVRSWARTRGRNCSPSRAHPRGELMRTTMLQGDVVTSL